MSYTDPNRDFTTNKIVLKEEGYANSNLNNLDVNTDQGRNKEVSIPILAQLIVLAIDVLNETKGSTLKQIRKCLCVSALINPTENLRRAMVWALKRGFVARPRWAVKSGQYGIYVKGDGVPIHVGISSSSKSKKKRYYGKKKKDESKKATRSRKFSISLDDGDVKRPKSVSAKKGQKGRKSQD